MAASHVWGWQLDALSADIIGADEADRAEARVELLQAALRAANRKLAIPGDLNGILSVEDEEHWGILRPDRPVSLFVFTMQIILLRVTHNG